VDISVVIVSYNVRELLRRCLASVYAGLQGLQGEVIVVDNASTDGSAEMVRREFPQVRLVDNPHNRGFAAANNQGIGLSRGRYILLLNCDAEVVGEALTTMVDCLDRHSEMGLVGPQLLNTDGSVQSSRRRFPTLATAFVESTILQRWLPNLGHLRRYYVMDRPDNLEQEVDWLIGACLLVRREVVEQVGPLDEAFFMYFEEVDWCHRIRQGGWKIVYLPSAQVVHHYGQSAEKDIPHRHIYFNNSKCKYYAKRYGPLAAAVIRLFLLMTFLYQMAEEGAKLALGHKAALRRHRLGVLFQVVRSGLKG